jgi:hypothetical protein
MVVVVVAPTAGLMCATVAETLIDRARFHFVRFAARTTRFTVWPARPEKSSEQRVSKSPPPFCPATCSLNTIDLVIRENGDVVLEGQDVGAAPREIFGDSDYEYWLTIRSEDKDRVFEGLLVEASDQKSAPGADKDGLVLDLLVTRFGKSSTPVKDLEEWLEGHSIPYAFDSYT